MSVWVSDQESAEDPATHAFDRISTVEDPLMSASSTTCWPAATVPGTATSALPKMLPVPGSFRDMLSRSRPPVATRSWAMYELPSACRRRITPAVVPLPAAGSAGTLNSSRSSWSAADTERSTKPLLVPGEMSEIVAAPGLTANAVCGAGVV